MPARPLSSFGRRRSIALLALTTAAAGGLALVASARLKKVDGEKGSNAAASAHFVGSQACAGCHPVEQAAWSSSHHRHAMEPADAKSVLGDFDDVTFRYFGRETRFWRQGSTFQVTTENQQGKAETFKVAYTLGVAPLQQYLVAFDDGRIQALPFAWDARASERGGQRWFHLYPDTDVTPTDPLFWMRPRQNWNHMCGDCHTTGFNKRFSDATGRFDSQWSELANGCESCHGAGSAHVEAAQHPGPAQHLALGAPAGRFVSGLHTQAEQLDQCGACHARRVRLQEGAPHERMHDTWRPELLQEGLYFVDGQIKDEVFEIGSFLQSKMAARGITCSHCHDPHTARLRAEGNALCTQCHDRQVFDGPQHHFHAAGTDGARCVNCHMPRRTYMVVHERRDHRIAVPRPDLSATLGTPNACATCHEARGNAWAADEIAKHRSGRRQGPSGAELLGPALWRARREQGDAALSVRALLDNPTVAGLSKATALSALGASAPSEAAAIAEPLLRATDPWLRLGAVEALGPAPDPARAPLLAGQATDASRAVRWAVAPLLGHASAATLPVGARDDVTALLSEYEAWLTANADRAEALVELAGLRRAAGDPVAARAAFERALRRDDTSIVALLNFADSLRDDGDDPRAETLLRKACALYPDSADAHFALGMLLVRRKEVTAGVGELGRAKELAPNNSHYAYAYGVGLHSLRQDERALATLSEARALPRQRTDSGGAAGALHRRERPGARSPLPVTVLAISRKTKDGEMFQIFTGRARVGIAIAVLLVPSPGTAADITESVKDFESPERGAWQKPGDVASLLQLWPGNVVADIGTGTGHFEPLLAKVVGATGRVLALDVPPHMVAYLKRRVKKEGLTNVTVQKVADNDPGLADGSVDRLLVVNTWHHLPQRTRYAAALNRALRPGGFVVVVDFTAESPKGPPAHARLSPATVIAELQSGGFSARPVAASLPLQYVVIGQKQGASQGRPAPTARQRALVDVIDANAGHARFTRGVNRQTVETLEKALSPTDDPELRALLYHDDPIVTRTAASVFAARGDRGLAVLREVAVDTALPANNRSVVDDVIWTANARQAAAMGARRYGNPGPERSRAPRPPRGAATALDED